MFVILGLGITCMAIGSRGKPADVQRERWNKSVWYGAIVLLMMWLALTGGGPLIFAGCGIVAVGAVELTRAASGPGRKDRPLRRYQALAALAYLALCAGFLRFLVTAGAEARVFVFLVVFCFDSFSQVTGQILGRRPLCPGISPNKTVEGLLGGLAAALIAAWVASRWTHFPAWAVFGALVAISSLAGDLAASHYKRRHAIKDFSNWAPYQGGFLDRFDSLIAAGAAWSLLSLAWRAAA